MALVGSASRPGVEHGGARLLIVAHVAGHDGKAVVERGRGDDQIGLRKRIADLAAVFDQGYGDALLNPFFRRGLTASRPSHRPSEGL